MSRQAAETHRLAACAPRRKNPLCLRHLAENLGAQSSAARDRFLEQMARVRQRTRAYADLVGEQPFRNKQQSLINFEQRSAPSVTAESERKWRRHTAFLQYFVAGLLQQAAERFKGEEPPVTDPKDSFAAIIELAEREHGARHE